jgi:peptidoglycan hydrolase-like protein with peptidoglycan-binding domain
MALAALLTAASLSGHSQISIASQGQIVPEGTVLALKMDTALSSKTAKAGDRFTAMVIRDVTLNSQVVIPTGSRVEGHVTVAVPARRMSRSGTIAVDFDRVILPNGRSHVLYGNLTSTDPKEKEKIDEENRISGGSAKKRSIVFIGGGAGVGAVIGVIVGGGKGAAVGAGVGAAAGTAAVLLAKGNEAIVKPGTEFGLELTRRIEMAAFSLSSSGQGIRRGDFSSSEIIRQAQLTLKQQNYYDGAIDGIIGPRFERAIRDFQRDRGLSETGELDERTAIRLGVTSEEPNMENRKNARGIKVTDAYAERVDDNAVRVVVDTEVPTGGWQTFIEHSIVNDQIHVWARGIPPSGTVTQAIVNGRLETTITNAGSYIDKIVVHGSSKDMTIKVLPAGGYSGAIGRKTADLLGQYEQALGVSSNGDQIIFDAGRNYTEDEVELLFALHGLQKLANSYSATSAPGVNPATRRGAARALLRQAHDVERLIQQARTEPMKEIARDWPTLEDDLKQLATSNGMEWKRSGFALRKKS